MTIYLVIDRDGVAHFCQNQKEALSLFKHLVQTFEQVCSKNPGFRRFISATKVDENQYLQKYKATYWSPISKRLAYVCFTYYKINYDTNSNSK